MRISDWSSDVCSSDLSSWLPTGSPVDHQRVQMSPPKMVDFDGMCHLPHDRGDARIAPDDETAASEGDRKSVVSGKSVSVRVDLGGPRDLKKNKERARTHNSRRKKSNKHNTKQS